MATTSSLIREAKKLDLNGAQPGAAAVVNRLVKRLEEERALRLRLQRELTALKRGPVREAVEE